jgi:cellulose biosynthesis protein BcsQ
VEEALEPGDEPILLKHIQGVAPDYDHLILDTPPGKGVLSSSALAAADGVAIPLQPDVLRFIQDIVWDRYNRHLEILGILPTMVRRTTSHSPGVVKKARAYGAIRCLGSRFQQRLVSPDHLIEGSLRSVSSRSMRRQGHTWSWQG